MIDIKLVKKSGLTEDEVVSILKRTKIQPPGIFLFPEYSFKSKFTNDRIKGLSERLPLDKDISAFFSIYELEPKEDVDKRIEDYVRICGGDRSRFDDPLTRHFFEPRCFNKGCLVSGTETENFISCYPKHICTELDSLNGYYGDNDVKTKHSKGEEITVGETYDEIDFSKERIPFSNLSIENKCLEFRVCADIECKSQNNPDVVLVSAHNLFYVPKRSKKSLDGKLLIVNDSGWYWFCHSPIGYKGDKFYKTFWRFSKACEKEGIKISSV